ncbi:MAG: rod shape-determining protein MreD [Acidimicrobiia bacterium]
MKTSRWALVIVLLTLVQVCVVPQLRIGGVGPEMFLVIAALAASRNGPEEGALVGFSAGLAYDCFLSPPFGASALAGALAGFIVGSSHVFFGRVRWWVTPGLAFVSGLVGGGVLLFAQVLAGNDGLASARSLVTVLVAAVFDAVTALWVFPFTRFVLGSFHFGHHRSAIRG